MAKLNNISIREQKFAQTKLAILNSVLNKLRDKPLSEILIKDICDEILISEATFFNYFKNKGDILIYFIQLWTIEMLWNARNKFGLTKGLDIIEKVFEETGNKLAEEPFIMYEIISFIALSRHEPNFHSLSLAEKIITYPDCEGIEFIEDDQLNSIFYKNILLAIENGDLPGKSDPMEVMTAVTSVFFGIPLMLKGDFKKFIPMEYLKSLKRIWKSFREVK